MNRRKFLGGAAVLAATAGRGSRMGAAVSGSHVTDSCGCDLQAVDASYAYHPEGQAAGREAFRDLSSGLTITNLKVFGVSLTPHSDRPYVFVKLETNQGLVG